MEEDAKDIKKKKDALDDKRKAKDDDLKKGDDEKKKTKEDTKKQAEDKYAAKKAALEKELKETIDKLNDKKQEVSDVKEQKKPDVTADASSKE